MHSSIRRTTALACAVLLAVLIAACGAEDEPPTDSAARTPDRLRVVATTTQLGDFARAVGGDRVKVTQLLRPNSDPHDYEPRPSDVRATADAALVLVSGAGLDEWMRTVISESGSKAKVVDLARAVKVELAAKEDAHAEEGHGHGEGAEEHADEEAHDHGDSELDPHWWHDPRNAIDAVDAIRDAMTRAQPSERVAFHARAAAYRRSLARLDEGIAACFRAVPPAERKLVTDHDAFGYFARRYDIHVVGAVIPAQTTQAQPSAGEVADLVRTIRREGVEAVFPESSVNSKLARAIAKESGASADHVLYGDTLGPAGSAGATYVSMELANADAMVRGFTGGARGCHVPGL